MYKQLACRSRRGVVLMLNQFFVSGECARNVTRLELDAAESVKARGDVAFSLLFSQLGAGQISDHCTDVELVMPCLERNR